MSRDLNELLPVVKEAAVASLAECKAQGLDVLITTTYRSPEEQNALYKQGRTTPGSKVTNAKAGQSLHQYRCAIDLVPMVHGKPEWSGAHPSWRKIAAVFKAHGFEWGYDWKTFKEMPHFQMTKGHPLSYFQKGGKI